MQVQNLMIKLQQDVRDCHAFFVRCGMCPEHMRWDVSGTRAGCIWDTCEHNLGAEGMYFVCTACMTVHVHVCNICIISTKTFSDTVQLVQMCSVLEYDMFANYFTLVTKMRLGVNLAKLGMHDKVNSRLRVEKKGVKGKSIQ